MGQYAYEDDDEEGGYTPRRIWPADYSRPQRYGVRALAIRRLPEAPSSPPPGPIKHSTLVLLAGVGLVVFACSTASLVIVAMLMDSTRVQVSAVLGELEQNRTQLAQLLTLMEAWLQTQGLNATGY
jgi:RecB family exonuclease